MGRRLARGSARTEDAPGPCCLSPAGAASASARVVSLSLAFSVRLLIFCVFSFFGQKNSNFPKSAFRTILLKPLGCINYSVSFAEGSFAGRCDLNGFRTNQQFQQVALLGPVLRKIVWASKLLKFICFRAVSKISFVGFEKYDKICFKLYQKTSNTTSGACSQLQKKKT